MQYLPLTGHFIPFSTFDFPRLEALRQMKKGGKAHISDDTVYQTDDLTEFPPWCKTPVQKEVTQKKEERILEIMPSHLISEKKT